MDLVGRHLPEVPKGGGGNDIMEPEGVDLKTLPEGFQVWINQNYKIFKVSPSLT